ncbi:MAG TPA: putative PEP-binding protein [Pararhizobium sp.]|uniref:putative PEP-binding protein n=1 Tax=Pararhizobium sp. TaxID=1977563 RepID=UPI002BFAF950|nr:putative PEP-binding protein [Pararhizobium sp.]HTO33769.1 putative PEP-binding protein [Pararhizobium sp.]
MSGALRLQGQGNGQGYAVGPAYVAPVAIRLSEGRVSPLLEFDLLQEAISIAIADLESLMTRNDPLSAEIIEFQVEMLRDPAIGDMAVEHIGRGLNAARAWATALEEYIAGFEQSGDDDVKARAVDVIDIRDRVLRALEGSPPDDFPPGSIFVGRDMAPSLFLGHDWTGGGGIVLEAGSTASHVALLARAKGVPMVVGLGSLAVETEMPVLADGILGIVVVHPHESDIAAAASREQDVPDRTAGFFPAMSVQNGAIELLLNINDFSEIHKLDPGVCDGIGLLRTEFLVPPADLLNEEKQVDLYRQVFDWAGDKPVTIRLFDLGGDKPLGSVGLEERNAFLGLRGIRLLLARPEILRVQVRALLRVGALGPLKVLLPMVTFPREVEDTRRLFEEEAAALAARQISTSMPAIGMMVEVPAAAIMLDTFTSADFFSLGTNDLAQYLTAAARDNPAVVDLYRQAEPAVLRLVAQAVKTARDMGKPIGICGDMASDPASLSRLLAVGLRQISVAPAQLGVIRTGLAQARVDS